MKIQFTVGGAIVAKFVFSTFKFEDTLSMKTI